jgi:hypothetical protein
MIQTVGTTTNFIIKYQDTDYSTNPPRLFVNALRRAQQLMATCEADFHTLRGWFGINDGFGPSNLVILQVETETLARNYGYKSDGTTFIRMNPFDSASDQALADDAVQGLFVAEAIEVLMDYRNKKNQEVSWHANWSDGEGLSRVAAATLHPSGYYTLLNAPFVNQWLQSARFPWVVFTDQTDTAQDSYGCAILFIYYLRDQLNHSISEIIQKGKSSLADTYQNLTGKNAGFVDFKNLLDQYLPYTATQKFTALTTDNPFPILQGKDRGVSLNFKEDRISAFNLTRRSPSVDVSPGFPCPPATYHYFERNLVSKLKCSATTTGFAQPKFTWFVNGLQASSGGSIDPIAFVSVDVAAHPEAPVNGTAQPRILWDIPSLSSGLGSELDLTNANESHPGHVHLGITVEVTETFGSTDSISQTSTGTLDTREIHYEQKFYDDRISCIGRLRHLLEKYLQVNHIPLIFTLPDPQPELRNGIRVLLNVIRELHVIREDNRELGAELTQLLAKTLQVPEEILHVRVGAQAPIMENPSESIEE